MAAFVGQIDLAEDLKPIRLARRYGAAWILVRFRRRPIGWIKLKRSTTGDAIAPDVLREAVAEQIGLQVHDAIRLKTYEPPSDSTPSISVVICTREHPDVLERQLKSLAKIEYAGAHEVIVVDNAPRSDRTRRVCEKFAFVRHILEPRPGLDYARNTGWQNARHEVVAYTDDDACVDPLWLKALGANYADPKVTCVTGITFPMELETEAQHYFERYGGMQRGFERKVYRPGTWSAFYPLGSGRFGAGVNLSLRRSTLEAMGGFDNALDVGSVARGCGDLDIMARALRDGGTLVYDPAAIVWHQHRQTMRQLNKQMFDYGWGFAAYCVKHSQDLELGNFSARMLRRWTSKWGRRRLLENLRLAVVARPHFPIHLILSEIWGGVLGLRAYRRSLKKVEADKVKFRHLYRRDRDDIIGSTRRARGATAA